MVLNGLNGTAAQNFVDYWYGSTKHLAKDRAWFFHLEAVGGKNSAYSRPGNNATAYAHRDKAMIIRFNDAVVDEMMAYPENGTSFLNNWIATVTAALPDGSWGAYANYPDSTLNRTMAQRLYYGSNLDRLRYLKLKYDPDELFYHPQSIEPAHDTMIRPWAAVDSANDL